MFKVSKNILKNNNNLKVMVETTIKTKNINALSYYPDNSKHRQFK